MKDKNLNMFRKHYTQGLLADNAFKKMVGLDGESDNENISGPLISVIIPTYNRYEKLKFCINSILSQSYQNYEIIIVDDGSTDGTDKMINEYNDSRIKFYKNKNNSGAGFSRKNGYQQSNGDYVIFCDDDDYFIDNNYFKEIVQIFDDKRYLVICSNSYIHYEVDDKYVLNDLNFETGISTFEYLKKFQFYYIKPNSTFSAVFRRDILEKNNFNDMQMVNDSSIYLRALLTMGMIYVNKKIIGIYRVHSKNISFNIPPSFLIENLEEKKKIFEIIKEKELFDANEWFKNQILLTTKYFLYNTTTAKENKGTILKWIEHNFDDYVVIYGELKKIEIKNALVSKFKKVIKKFR